MVDNNSEMNSSTRLELMGVTSKSHEMGINFHIFLRGQMPSVREFPGNKTAHWNTIRDRVESRYEWLPEHHFEWSELNHLAKPHNHYGIHLQGGVTIFRTDSTQRIKVIYDQNSDKKLVEELISMFNKYKRNQKIVLVSFR